MTEEDIIDKVVDMVQDWEINEMAHQGLLFFILILTVVLVPVLIWLLIHTFKQYKEDHEKLSIAKVVVIICVICALVSASIGLALVDDQEPDRVALTLRVEIDTSQITAGVLYTPVTVNEQLRESLELTGDGEFSIVDTEKGEALRIEFVGNVTVYGRIESIKDIENWNLTMITGEYNEEAWISLELEGNETDGVDLSLYCKENQGPSIHIFLIVITLNEGWRTYSVDEKRT